MALLSNGGAGSPASASASSATSAPIPNSGAGSPGPSLSASFAEPQSAPAAEHFVVPAPQLFTGFADPIVTTNSATITTSSFDIGNGVGAPTMPSGGSLFSSEFGQGLMTVGSSSSGHTDLPFMHDAGAGDPLTYSASTETAWLFVSDFGRDGWFFV